MDTASKHVQFVLEAVVDQDARATVLSFATELKRAQDSLKGFTQATVSTLAGANAEISKTLHSLADTRTKVAEAGVDRLAAIEENLARIIRDRSRQSTDAVLDDIAARVRAEEEAAARIRDIPPPEPAAAGGGAGDGGGDPPDAEQERRAKAYEDANLRIIKSDTLVATSSVKSAGMSEAAYESLQGQLRNMRREMFATAAEASGSLMQMARGFMAMGLASEKELETVARGLVRVQSMFDIVSGGTRVMLALEKVMHLYAASTDAARVAQEGLNASMIRGQAIGSVSALGGAGAAGGGLFGKLKGLFTSKAAKEALDKADEVQRLREAAMLGTSAAASVAPAAATAPRTIMGISMARTYGGAAVGGGALLGAAGGAIAGVGMAGMSIYDMARQASANQGNPNGYAGIGAGAAPGSWSDRLGGSDFNPYSWYFAADVKLSRMKSDKALARQEKKGAAFIESANQDYERMDQKAPDYAAAMASARDSANAIFRQTLETMTVDEKRVAIANRLASTEAESARLKTEHAQIDERFVHDKLLNENTFRASLNEQIDLLRERINLERSAAETRKAAMQHELAAETEVLSKLQAQVQLGKDQLLSAKERFAMMNEADQASITQLTGRLKSGAKLSAEEMGRLSSFRELGGVKKAFDAELERRAQAGGFDKAFGVDAKEAIAIAEQQLSAQRTLVTDMKAEINVRIDADTKKITDSIEKQVGEKLKQLETQIQQSVTKLGGEITDIKQRIVNRAVGPGGP